MAVCTVDAARILAVLPIGAKSHHRFMQPVAMALARAGHTVVVYSPLPALLPDPPANLTHVRMANVNVVDETGTMNHLIQKMTAYPFWKCLDPLWNFLDIFYEEVINDTKFKDLLSSDEKFDLIITETFTSQEFIAQLLVEKFKVPMIGLQSFPTNNLINNILGNTLSLSYIPDTCALFSNKMTFLERLANAFASLRGLYYYSNYYIPLMESFMKKDFPNSPRLQVSDSVALLFVNDHLTADYARPRPPNIIPVGGIHIQPPQPLPQELQKFMDEARHGVIFFSLGTYVLDDLEPEEYFKMYINIFRRLKQRVLWKTRRENIQGLPPNVMTLKWAPQKDILGISIQNGQLSTISKLDLCN